MADLESSPVALSSERSMGLAASVVAGRYRLGAVMAVSRDVVVYAADDTTADRQVALAILRDEVAADADFVAAVWEQARKLASPACAHRAIARVYDTGVTDAGVLFVAGERVVGRTLRDVLEARGPLDPYNALRIAIQVGEALEVLHHRGVIHGEVRPESVVLVRGEGVSEQAKLVGVELTVAHRTAIGVRRRDPSVLPYLAPEQTERAQTTEAADVHALGRLLRELLTAEPSRENRSPRVYAAVVPATIENIIASALQERPEERYPDVTVMLNDMWGAQSEFEAPKPRPRAAQRPALPQIQWPRVQLPHVQLPRIQWPRVQWPSLPRPQVGRRELGIASIGVGGIALAAIAWVAVSHGIVSKLRVRVAAPAFTTAPVDPHATLPSPSTLPASRALAPAEATPPAATRAPEPRAGTPSFAEPRRPEPGVPSEPPAPKRVDVGKAIEPAPAKRLDTPRAIEPPTRAAAPAPAQSAPAPTPSAPAPAQSAPAPTPSGVTSNQSGVAPSGLAQRGGGQAGASPITAATPGQPSEARPPATARRPTAGDQAATDGDGAAIIDWLLKPRR